MKTAYNTDTLHVHAVREPLLSPEHWRRHNWNSLIHKSGRTIVFHGPDPTASRDRMLRELSKLKPKVIKLPKAGHSWMDESDRPRRRSSRRRKFRLWYSGGKVRIVDSSEMLRGTDD